MTISNENRDNMLFLIKKNDIICDKIDSLLSMNNFKEKLLILLLVLLGTVCYMLYKKSNELEELEKYLKKNIINNKQDDSIDSKTTD